MTNDRKPIIALRDLEGKPYGMLSIERDEFNQERCRSLEIGMLVELGDPPLTGYKQLFVDPSIEELTLRSGKVTSACLTSCWYRTGKKCDVPHKSKCVAIGELCGHYVWVPECNRLELTKLTLVILDIAWNDPAVAPSTQQMNVSAILNCQGKITRLKDEGVYCVAMLIPRSEGIEAVATPCDLKETPVTPEDLEEVRTYLEKGPSEGAELTSLVSSSTEAWFQ